MVESPCDAVSEGSEISASACNVSVATQPSMGVQSFSVEENINLTVERGSSLFVHEHAQSFTEDGTSNMNAGEFNISIYNFSAASAVTESTEGNATPRMKH